MNLMDCSAKRIALFIVTAKAHDTESRWILNREDLTDTDKAEIKVVSEKVLSVLKNGNGKSWDSVLEEIRKLATESFCIGPKEQDRVITDCVKSGVIFTNKPRANTRRRIIPLAD